MDTNRTKLGAFKQNVAAFLKARGFYVVLGLCVLCIGIAAAVRFIPKGTPDGSSAPPDQAASQSSDERLGAALSTPQPTATPLPVFAGLTVSTPSPSPLPTLTPTPTAAAKTRATKAAPPVEGSVIWGFATEQLLYSKTLEQWTTHPGVDIAAHLNSDVRAILAGTVSSVYTHDALGITVEVSHDGGMISMYANLAENPPVKKGQKLNAGAVIGKVGDTAPSECALEPHLHFAIYRDNTPLDPAAYVLLG